MMFNRSQMKSAVRARLAVGGRWTAVLVCLIAAALSGGVSVNAPSFSIDIPVTDASSVPSFGSEWMFDDSLPALIGFLCVIVGIALAIGIAYTALVANVVNVGLKGWCLRYARNEIPSVKDVFLGFRIFGKVVPTVLLRDVFIFLWSLLLVIPGIIKGYSYSLVPYLIYENPKLTPKQAIKLSETMMDGWKAEAFVLDLSFIGWRLLSVLTLGILDVLYVNPYYETAYAMFYDTVRYDALYVRRVITHADVADDVPTSATETPQTTYYECAPSYEVPAADPFRTDPIPPTMYGITEDLSVNPPQDPTE